MPLTPILIRDFNTDQQSVSPLPGIPLGSPLYNESWLQELIHQHPALVPAGEVESYFEGIIPIARELPLGSGYLDNLYFTPDGYPVLVEVKLWKNQESRRKVVTQILEYAKDFAELKYENLNDKVRRLRSKEALGENALFEIIKRNTAHCPSETEFIDRVVRNLLLIVGDGVREDMESLAKHLMQHHSLRYSFGIVQIRLFTLPDNSMVAIPDVMAKTQTIERHVTVVITEGAGVTVHDGSTRAHVITDVKEKTSFSLDEFYEIMRKTSPGDVLWLKSFIESLSELGIEAKVGQNGDRLRLMATLWNGDVSTHLIYIDPPNVQFWGTSWGGLRKTPEGQKAMSVYLDRIIGLVLGASLKGWDKTGELDVRISGRKIPIALLRGKENGLKEAIAELMRTPNPSEPLS